MTLRKLKELIGLGFTDDTEILVSSELGDVYLTTINTNLPKNVMHCDLFPQNLSDFNKVLENSKTENGHYILPPVVLGISIVKKGE